LLLTLIAGLSRTPPAAAILKPRVNFIPSGEGAQPTRSVHHAFPG
jgi:hypothetical protein